jgi:muramidase (phage lysozyme)
VDRLVVSTFLGQQSEQDNNLQFVRDMLTNRAPESVLVLKTYREIWRGKRSVVDEEQSLVKSHLKLSGVVRREGRALQIRNRIYRQVFDGRWIQTHLPENWWQRLKPAMPIIATLLVALIVMTGLVIYANQQRQIAIDALHQREKAEQQTVIVGKQRQEAIKQSQLLEGLLRRSSIATPTLRPKLKAFLDMIAWSLGTAQPNGYSLIFSGDSFTNFKDHPRQLKCAIYLGKRICSDTAGRYSLVSSTWDDLVQKLQLPDFSPVSQDQAAIELIREQNALEDLEIGKLESAIYKASQVWGSLPNSNGVSNYEFQVPSVDTLRSVYEIYYLKSLYPVGKSLQAK